jgi:radical SAM protein with 4Fe4S-binding SPASM domain
VIERLSQQPPFFIDVSCHSVTEEKFDWFTQVKGSYRQFVTGMARLKASGLPFRMKSIGMTWNQDEWGQIRRFVESFDLPFRPSATLFPRLNGDLGPLDLRLSPQEVMALDTDPPAAEDDGCRDAEDCVSRPVSRRLYRCTCATNTIHINAWGELGTCTLEYEVRASLRSHSLKEAIDRVFRQVRALNYTQETPCRDCHLYIFCNKKPTAARQQFLNPEAPNPHECDVAFLKASQITRQPLMHPLQGKEEMSHARPEEVRAAADI